MKLRTFVVPVILLVAAPLLGMGCKSTSPASALLPEGGGEEDVGETHHERGLGPLLDHHLDKLTLRPEQRTAVESIRSDLQQQMAPVHAAGKALGQATADAVAAGTFDHAKLDPLIGSLGQAADATRPAVEQAMQKLYGTLDPEQRKQLVSGMERNHEHADHAMRGEEARENGGGERGGPRGGGPGGGGPGGAGPGFGRDLDLTPEQRKSIREKLREAMKSEQPGARDKMKAVHDHMKLVADAFASDKFDAHAVEVGKYSGDMARQMSEGMVRMLEITTSVLTPEQRTKLSTQIKARSERTR